MSRQLDLEQAIRQSYAVLREWERLLPLGNPTEKARAEQEIGEQRTLICRWLQEFVSLNVTLPPDLAELAAALLHEEIVSMRVSHPTVRPTAIPSTVGNYFLSYSPADGDAFALKLYNALKADPLLLPVWLDKYDLEPSGPDPSKQAADAINGCKALLLVMTPSSVSDYCDCEREWRRALQAKKPIVLLQVTPEAQPPFYLSNRQIIDFTGAFDSTVSKLGNYLVWLATPEGDLQSMKDRMVDAQRDLRYASDPVLQARIQNDIEYLRNQIAEQQNVVSNPQEAARRVRESIERGLESERQPEKPGGASPSRFVNPPPGVAPVYFQDRYDEIRIINDFLQDEAKRLLIVAGRAGIGKTALVCRVLKSLENGQIPNEGGLLNVDGIIYLSAVGARRLNMPNLYADLCRLLPAETAKKMDVLYRDPAADTEAKMRELLAMFLNRRTVVLLDKLDNLIDPVTCAVQDIDLDRALRAFLTLPHHAVKVIITTRVAPRNLVLLQPGIQARLELDGGLDSPYAENILRQMDVDGKVGLKTASGELLTEARKRTRGYPRALEALFAILCADRHTSIQEILEDTEHLLPENVVEALVGEAFIRLDASARQVMQALAVYGRPVTPAAVDYLLQPYLPGVNSTPVLNRLVTMHFAQKEGRRYYLHPIDRSCVLESMPWDEESGPDLVSVLSIERGDVAARSLPDSDTSIANTLNYTRRALLRRGATFFREMRKPASECLSIEDLEPHLVEFDLHCAAHDWVNASEILSEIGYDYLVNWGFDELCMEMASLLESEAIGTALWKLVLVHDKGVTNRRSGNFEEALRCFGQALEIIAGAKEESGLPFEEKRKMLVFESSVLNDMGNAYAMQARFDDALQCYESAYAIAAVFEDYEAVARSLENKGQLLIDLGQFSTSIDIYRQALEAADKVRYSLIQNYANWGLALACLYNHDLSAARLAAEEARKHDVPRNNHNVLTVLGVVLLKQGRADLAHGVFQSNLAEVEEQIERNPRNLQAYLSKGLSLCGLILCGQSRWIDQATVAFQSAKSIAVAPGSLMRGLRLLDALSEEDTADLIGSFRKLLEQEAQPF